VALKTFVVFGDDRRILERDKKEVSLPKKKEDMHAWHKNGEHRNNLGESYKNSFSCPILRIILF
jgi:hypothetical protein